MELEAQLIEDLRMVIIFIMKKKHCLKKMLKILEKILDSDLYIKLIIYMYISVCHL